MKRILPVQDRRARPGIRRMVDPLPEPGERTRTGRVRDRRARPRPAGGDSRLHLAADAGEVWQLDPAACEVRFSATRRGSVWVDGSFPVLRGSLSLDWDDPLATELEGEVDIRSLVARDPRMNTEARARDLLEPERNRVIGFRAHALERTGPASVLAVATLLIGGQSRDVQFDLAYAERREAPPGAGNGDGAAALAPQSRAVLRATADLRRVDLDPARRASYPSIVDGGVVRVTAALEAVRPV